MKKYFAIVKRENGTIVDCSNCPSVAEDTITVEITEDVFKNIEKYIAVKHEEEIDVPDYDEETGEQTGTHKETVITYTIELNPDYEQEQITKLKKSLNDENTFKAKEAVENGYVSFKNAQFETNAQTVGDLTATMLLMQASGLEVYSWLSKDDKVVELSLEDFGTLGGLIAGYKAHIWNEEYMGYKTQIEEAQTVEELKEIEINY